MGRRAARRIVLALHYLRWSWRFERYGWGSTLGRPHKPGGLKRVSIGEGVELGPFWRLEAIGEFHGRRHDGRIEIGDGVAAEIGLHVAAAGEVVIGPEVLIAAWVFISDHSHPAGGSAPGARRRRLLARRALRDLAGGRARRALCRRRRGRRDARFSRRQRCRRCAGAAGAASRLTTGRPCTRPAAMPATGADRCRARWPRPEAGAAAAPSRRPANLTAVP
jgi:hypothetical protein